MKLEGGSDPQKGRFERRYISKTRPLSDRPQPRLADHGLHRDVIRSGGTLDDLSDQRTANNRAQNQ